MKINPISITNIGKVNVAKHNHTTSVVDFARTKTFNKKALKEISLAALLCMAMVLMPSCKQPTDSDYPTVEAPATQTTPVVDDTTPTIEMTALSPIFEASKALFDVLGLNTVTEKVTLKENAYTPHSGDVLSVEYQISPSTKQVFTLDVEKSTPDKLVYKNAMVYVTAPDTEYSYISTFEKDENGDIIRKDDLTPGTYFKYSLTDDNQIKINSINTENDAIDYRETIYYQQGTDSSNFIRIYRDTSKYYSDAKVTVAE